MRERGPVEDSIPPTAGITSPIDAQPDALLTGDCKSYSNMMRLEATLRSRQQETL